MMANVIGIYRMHYIGRTKYLDQVEYIEITPGIYNLICRGYIIQQSLCICCLFSFNL